MASGGIGFQPTKPFLSILLDKMITSSRNSPPLEREEDNMNNELVVERLKMGIKHFQQNIYPPNAEMYRRAAAMPQQPHTLVIACADSRVNVELITNSHPGELFVTRNVGNMVPAYSEPRGGVSAVIEYAVTGLGVRHIVICGHSDCGAMKGLLNTHSAEQMPSVRTWLANGHSALRIAESVGQPSPEQRLRSLTQQNVLMQLAHLKTHPCVAEALALEQLTLSGWVYEIGTGEVRIAEDGLPPFVPLVNASGHESHDRL
jgi:carbonic anhydrase